MRGYHKIYDNKTTQQQLLLQLLYLLGDSGERGRAQGLPLGQVKGELGAAANLEADIGKLHVEIVGHDSVREGAVDHDRCRLPSVSLRFRGSHGSERYFMSCFLLWVHRNTIFVVFFHSQEWAQMHEAG